MELYTSREVSFSKEVMREVERDIYFQVLDNLWMQHLENMEHVREGIGWVGVGQRDPLVEYRRRGQELFEAMQVTLRHDVLRSLFHAQPLSQAELNQPVETELTRAARQSVANTNQIVEAEEFHEEDFSSSAAKASTNTAQNAHKKLQKKRKAERQRRAKSGKKRK